MTTGNSNFEVFSFAEATAIQAGSLREAFRIADPHGTTPDLQAYWFKQGEENPAFSIMDRSSRIATVGLMQCGVPALIAASLVFSRVATALPGDADLETLAPRIFEGGYFKPLRLADESEWVVLADSDLAVILSDAEIASRYELQGVSVRFGPMVEDPFSAERPRPSHKLYLFCASMAGECCDLFVSAADPSSARSLYDAWAIAEDWEPDSPPRAFEVPVPNAEGVLQWHVDVKEV